MTLDQILAATGSSRFAAVNVVRRRADELAAGAIPRVPVESFDRHVPTAIRELEAGRIEFRRGEGAPAVPRPKKTTWA
jgi:DNA-directed RNA polymerase subunit K/omega